MANQKAIKWVLGIVQAALGILLAVGLLFQLQHWPGAGLMVYSSITGFALVYLLKFFTGTGKVLQDYLRLALIVVWLVRFVFYISHWPYASMVNVLFLLILSLWWLIEGPFYFFSPPGTKLDTKGWLTRIVYNIASGAVVWAAYSKISGNPLPNLLMFGGMALLFVMLAIDFARGKIQSQRKLASNILFTVAGGSIMVGVYFRLAHYPYSEYLLGFGLLIVAIWFVLEFVLPKNDAEGLSENDIESDE